MVSLVNLVFKQKAVHVSFGLTKQLVIYWALYSCCKKYIELFVCFWICICVFIRVFVYFVLNTAVTSCCWHQSCDS